jgi:hypothetical protein
MMTKQEMFDISAKHILAQGAQSYAVGRGCLYRGPHGRMCGFGPFIPEDKYTPELERKNAAQVIEILGLDLDPDFSCCLQGCHDAGGDEFISAYKRRMRELAQRHDLDASILGDDELS